jgi:ABC-type uncharacterized transport system YnjBCD ATPase subunit
VWDAKRKALLQSGGSDSKEKPTAVLELDALLAQETSTLVFRPFLKEFLSALKNNFKEIVFQSVQKKEYT